MGNFELPVCKKCVEGKLVPLSDYGRDGAPIRYKAWGWVSKINERHGMYALITLGSLVVANLYIMLVASETITDLRIFN